MPSPFAACGFVGQPILQPASSPVRREAHHDMMKLTKKLSAISTVLTLLAILFACPVLSCLPMAASDAAHSCCPHSRSHSAPQSQTSAQDCPYLLLEKGKHSSFGADAPALLPAPVSLAAIARPLSMAERDIHIADSSGLFLRLRVLLI